MFGTSSISTAPSTGTTGQSLFSTAAPATSSATTQAPLSFGAASFSTTSQTPSRPVETSTAYVSGS
ncbi:hypothetical protein COOONC_27064, partial [Cooperia oncophora]